jgi:hypothetical protein
LVKGEDYMRYFRLAAPAYKGRAGRELFIFFLIVSGTGFVNTEGDFIKFKHCFFFFVFLDFQNQIQTG